MDAESPVTEMAVEEEYSVPETLSKILHENHCPEVCAVAVNRVYDRNESLRTEIIELLDKIISMRKEETQLKKNNLSLEITMKSQLAKFKILEKEVEQAKMETSESKRKLEEAMEQKLNTSMAYDNLGSEIDSMRKQIFDLEDTLRKESEFKEKILEQLEKSRNTNDALVLRISTLQAENEELEKIAGPKRSEEDLEKLLDREADLNKREQELQNAKQWVDQQLQEVEEQKRELELWDQDKELMEKEMDRLRDCNRSMRRELSHPNNKPEPNKLKSELNAYIAREDDLRRQLFKSNAELIELQKLLSAHNITVKRRKTFSKQTLSSAQKH